jgi:hypothetical protein
MLANRSGICIANSETGQPDTPELGRCHAPIKSRRPVHTSPAGGTLRASHTATAGRNPRSQPTGRRAA